MKANWLIISLVLSILSGVLVFVFTKDLIISAIAFTVVLIIALINNPKRRYIRAFWSVMAMVMVLNKWYFNISGQYEENRYNFGTLQGEAIVSVFLIILAIFCLILDYLERNESKLLDFVKPKKAPYHELQSSKVLEYLEKNQLTQALIELKAILARDGHQELRESVMSLKANVTALKRKVSIEKYQEVISSYCKTLLQNSKQQDIFFQISILELSKKIKALRDESENYF